MVIQTPLWHAYSAKYTRKSGNEYGNSEDVSWCCSSAYRRPMASWSRYSLFPSLSLSSSPTRLRSSRQTSSLKLPCIRKWYRKAHAAGRTSRADASIAPNDAPNACRNTATQTYPAMPAIPVPLDHPVSSSRRSLGGKRDVSARELASPSALCREQHTTPRSLVDTRAPNATSTKLKAISTAHADILRAYDTRSNQYCDDHLTTIAGATAQK